ncbi:MAG: type I DNA topoisomerase [Fimbriimonadaceae bacterium]|nr:type I DNA topoisomerase [Fimbriimonadaceae bacterium]
MSKTLVIVESPAKARTISGFLGPGYEVVASYGHVRDLPEKVSELPEEVRKKPWAQLGVDVDDEFQPYYVVPSDKSSRVAQLRREAKGAGTLLLATDEDREGESISWHVLELIKPSKTVNVKRVVFHEVTPEAIQAAVAAPRDLDLALVKAQEVRRILDRLYGYTLSPLLWRKVARGLSAGRVQSVAVRLIVERERERMRFREAVYFDLSARLPFAHGSLEASLTRIDEKAVASGQDFSLEGECTAPEKVWITESQAAEMAARLDGTKGWACTVNETKPGTQKPPPPFMTSSLQQEGVRKLRMKARQVMQIAQQLYEGIEVNGQLIGLITYMRTDSLTLSERSLQEARDLIRSQYGPDYLPAKAVRYKSKAKNAQEAHEAIRPTQLDRTPASVAQHLNREQLALYDLIWKRTLACQMVEARLDRTRIEVETEDAGRTLTFQANGTRISFPGFLRVYVEGSDDPASELEQRDKILPKVEVGERSGRAEVESARHATLPPARYNEASLVRKLEAEGIGRPSTYASIIGTIQDRGYVFRKGNELVPSWSAFAVTQLLEDSFARLVDIRFTADMEEELDEIANGQRDAVDHLRRFYRGSPAEPGLEKQVEDRKADIPFPNMPLGEDIIVRIGRNGAFLQRGEGGTGNTASVPEGLPPADLDLEAAKRLLDASTAEPDAVGVDPETGQCVFAKTGRFGPYLEVGTDEEKPRRISLPAGIAIQDITDEDLGLLLRFPRTVGEHEGDPVTIQIGRYGPYVSCGARKASLADWRTAASVSLDEAVAALNQKVRGGSAALRALGEITGVEGEVRVMSGRYGPYVTNGKVNATIPKGIDPETLSAETAADLIQKKIAAGPAKRPFRKSRRQR